MKVVERLKKAFKLAIRSGKIIYVKCNEESYTSDKIPEVSLLNMQNGNN